MSQPPLHRLVVPDMPPPADYAAALDAMQQARWFTNYGPISRQFEAALLRDYGRGQEACVACNSATSGLTAALIAMGRKGRVILPAFTFAASLGAIRAAGLEGVVIDVDPVTWAMDTTHLAKALQMPDIAAVMLVCPFGMAQDWTSHLELCTAHGVPVVIDNASGLGGPRPVADYGASVFEVFSMHATKPFAIGEGGAIFADPRHEAALRAALNFGLNPATAQPAGGWGMNGKLSELHAAVGLAQAARFATAMALRQAQAGRYRGGLAGRKDLVCPQDAGAAPWQSYPVLLPSAASATALIDKAAAAGIEIRRYYRPSLSQWAGVTAHCPVAEDLADRMCLLPIRGLNGSDDTVMIQDQVLDLLRNV